MGNNNQGKKRPPIRGIYDNPNASTKPVSSKGVTKRAGIYDQPTRRGFSPLVLLIAILLLIVLIVAVVLLGVVHI